MCHNGTKPIFFNLMDIKKPLAFLPKAPGD